MVLETEIIYQQSVLDVKYHLCVSSESVSTEKSLFESVCFVSNLIFFEILLLGFFYLWFVSKFCVGFRSVEKLRIGLVGRWKFVLLFVFGWFCIDRCWFEKNWVLWVSCFCWFVCQIWRRWIFFVVASILYLDVLVYSFAFRFRTCFDWRIFELMQNSLSF